MTLIVFLYFGFLLWWFFFSEFHRRTMIELWLLSFQQLTKCIFNISGIFPAVRYFCRLLEVDATCLSPLPAIQLKLLCVPLREGPRPPFVTSASAFETRAQTPALNLLWNFLADRLPWGQIFAPISGFRRKPSGFSKVVFHLLPCLDILLGLLDDNIFSTLPSCLLSLSKLGIILICQPGLPFIIGEIGQITASGGIPTLRISPPTVPVGHCHLYMGNFIYIYSLNFFPFYSFSH